VILNAALEIDAEASAVRDSGRYLDPVRSEQADYRLGMT
jgi:hypothetical protein